MAGKNDKKIKNHNKTKDTKASNSITFDVVPNMMIPVKGLK